MVLSCLPVSDTGSAELGETEADQRWVDPSVPTHCGACKAYGPSRCYPRAVHFYEQMKRDEGWCLGISSLFT